MNKLLVVAGSTLAGCLIITGILALGSALGGLMGMLIAAMFALILFFIVDAVMPDIIRFVDDRLDARKDKQWEQRQAQIRQEKADAKAAERADMLLIRNAAQLVILRTVGAQVTGGAPLFDMDAVTRRQHIQDVLLDCPDIRDRENIVAEVEDAITSPLRKRIASEYGLDVNTPAVRTLPDHLRGETLTIALNGVRTAARRKHQDIQRRRYGKFATASKA